MGLLLLVCWNVKASNAGADVGAAPELEVPVPVLKPANPPNAGTAGLLPPFFSVNEGPLKVDGPNLRTRLVPAPKPLNPPPLGVAAPDEPPAPFKPVPNVEPVPSVLELPKIPLVLGCSDVAEEVATLDAFAEGPKNPPFRLGGATAVCVSVEGEAKVVVLAEGPKNPPFLLFGGSAAVDIGAGAAELDAAPLIENPPNRPGGADPSVAVAAFANAGTSFPSPVGGVELSLVGAGAEELLWAAWNARTCLPNGPSELKVGAGLGGGRLIPEKAGCCGSAGRVVAVAKTGAAGGVPKRLDMVGCDD